MLKGNEILRDALAKQNGCEENFDRVYEVMGELLRLCEITRIKGLLAIEEELRAMFDIDESLQPEYAHYRLRGADRLIVELMMLIVDGTAPELVAEI